MGDKSVTDSVVVPLLRAAITGLLCALAIVTVYDLFQAVTGWRLFAFIAAAVCLAAWLYAMAQPGAVADERVYDAHTKVEIVAKDPAGAFKSGAWADFPVSKGLIIGAARYYLKTGRFSLAICGPGKPLTRSQFEALRDEMVARGLAYWVRPGSHNQGVALTRAGNAFMEKLAAAGEAQARTGAQAKFWPTPTPGKERWR